MERVNAVFAALSDPIRLRALALMAREGELCVCELTHALATSQPKVSKHLAVLRDSGLVQVRRDAQWMLYSVAGDLPPWARTVVAAAADGLEDDAGHRADQARLRGMAGRPSRNRAA
ncbi:MAG TPA: metalloregulator ArsR/SmtB family transcription factor [Azospirillum sp.]|nr:metalloregulator ArsR/SmtB family transcription factor [Azospirillum sp.]